MAYKVLGQSAPAATTNTDVYTVPSAKSAVISTIALANRGASALTYRVAVRPAGAAIASQHYIAYDVTLPANSSDFLTIGVALATTDVLTVYTSAATLSVSVFGDES
jgi:hypothetical protein